MKDDEDYIDNPSFKMMTLVNGITCFIQVNKKDFKGFFDMFNSNNKKSFFIKGVDPQE